MTDFDVVLVAEQLNDKLVEERLVLNFEEIHDVVLGFGGELDDRDSLLLVLGRNAAELSVETDGFVVMSKQVLPHFVKLLIDSIDYLNVFLLNSEFLESQVFGVLFFLMMRTEL